MRAHHAWSAYTTAFSAPTPVSGQIAVAVIGDELLRTRFVAHRRIQLSACSRTRLSTSGPCAG